MATFPVSPRWLWLLLLVAAISLALATIDLLGALIAFARGSPRRLGGLALPTLILLLSVFTLRLAIPPLRPGAKSVALTKRTCWLALLLGVAAAGLSGAELVYGVMQEGIAIFLDFPVVMVLVLSLSCSAIALLGLRNQRV